MGHFLEVEGCLLTKLKGGHINEASGMAASRKSIGHLVICNDENGPIYYFNGRSGDETGSFTLKGRTLIDPEALFVDLCGYLWVSDTGNNDLDRTTTYLYKLAEPGKGKHGPLANTRYAIQFKDSNSGPVVKRNVEAFFIDPVTQTPYMIDKREGNGALYKLPKSLSSSGVNYAIKTGKKMPELVSDACFNERGSKLLVRNVPNPARILAFNRNWSYFSKFPVPSLPKGETITMDVGGKSIWIGTETKKMPNVSQDLLNVALPSAFR